MKTLPLFVIIFSLFFIHNLNAQSTDTISSQDTTIIDSISTSNTLNLNIDNYTAGSYIQNISKMIFWPRYGSNFVIGVTDFNTKYFLNRFFLNRKIHGLKVKIIYITETNSPFVNLIYIPNKKNFNTKQIIQNYNKMPVIFISANRSDWPLVDFVFKPTANDLIIRANKNNLSKKKVILTPMLQGLSMVY